MTTDADILTDLAQRLPAARKALAAAVGDIPASGGSGGSGNVSDRTGNTAVRLAAHPDTDVALAATRELDRLERQVIARRHAHAAVTDTLVAMQRIVDRWAPTPRQRQASNETLRAAANDLLNRHDDAGNCRSCKRDPGSWGEPHRRGLCRSCIRYLDRCVALYEVDLELPPVALIVVLRERGKVTDADIHRVMVGQRRRDA